MIRRFWKNKKSTAELHKTDLHTSICGNFGTVNSRFITEKKVFAYQSRILPKLSGSRSAVGSAAGSQRPRVGTWSGHILPFLLPLIQVGQ